MDASYWPPINGAEPDQFSRADTASYQFDDAARRRANALRNSYGPASSQNYTMPPATSAGPMGFMGGYPGMGYGAAGAGGYGNSYGGFGQTFMGPQAGGMMYAPGAAQAMYRQAYQQAQQGNEQRYKTIGGFDQAAFQLPQRKNPTTGDAEIQVNGQWMSQKSVDPKALNADIGQRSNLANMTGGYYGLRARAMTDVANMGNISDFYGNRTKQGLSYLDPLNKVAQQYQDRIGTGMGYVSNAGVQDRNDINRQYDNLGRKELSDLTDRGLGNSTVTSSVRQAVEADRAQAIGRSYADTAGIQAQTYGNLSGQSLAFAGQVPQIYSSTYGNLSGQQGNWMQDYGKLGLNTDMSTTGNMLQFAERANQPYPNPSLYYGAAQGAANYGPQANALSGLRSYYGV